jgi:hypothetical protein
VNNLRSGCLHCGALAYRTVDVLLDRWFDHPDDLLD